MIENIEDKDDYVMVFEAPKIIPPEFRLYYDEESGKVLFYTCEKPEGKFIIVDQVTFACARMDMKVVDGRLTSGSPSAVITKLMPDSEKGVECALEDISIIGYGSFNDTQKWKLNVYELR